VNAANLKAHAGEAGAKTAAGRLEQALRLTLDEDELVRCMRCGFCQSACPTFLVTGLEAASPRGRIALMKAAYDGFMAADSAFVDQMELCLGCRACEPACPAGVQYGRLIEQTREAIAAARKPPLRARLMGKVLMEGVIARHGTMRWAGRALRFYQRSGLRTAARKLGVLRVLPPHVRELEASLPDASGRGVIREWLRRGLPARWETDAQGRRLLVVPAEGQRVARVGMFRGCVMDVLFLSTNVNTVRLLRAAGFEVVIPERQKCCGALHAHAGNGGTARGLAADNAAVFRDADVDWVVSNAGGCGAFLKEYDHVLHGTPAADEGAWLASRVKDVSELLAEQGRPLRLANSGPLVATCQDSCHLRNVMRVQRQPRELLKSVPGLTLREMREADLCCGSAGIYNVLQPEMSTALLDRKMENVKDADAEVVVTANPGCLLQMRWGIHRAGLEGRVKAVHLVDLLAERLE
jgi:glycolate oxidase iron-sulfur subunit